MRQWWKNMEANRKAKLLEAGINVDSALERFMGNEKMLEKYLGRFLSEKSYAALQAAVAADDQAAAGAAVHALKSVCGTIGCLGMQDMIVAQEKAIRGGDWEGAKAMMPEIDATYRVICAALQDQA